MMNENIENALVNDESTINLQWFPGHMTKTRRLITEHLKQVDIVAEILDARIPRSSQNPVIDELLGAKPRIVLLNKADIANQNANKLWVEHFGKKGINAVLTDSMSGKGLDSFKAQLKKTLAQKLERDRSKGMTKAIKVMIAGIPNVGKSSFINRLSGEKKAKAEDRPGVTRAKQWIFLDGLALLDTPGILWPKFEDKNIALNLAFTGAIKDDIYDIESVAAALLLRLKSIAPQSVFERYKVDTSSYNTGIELLCAVGKKRGFLISGGEIDTQRAAKIVLDEFRGAKIGRITLELPEGDENE